MDSAKTQMCTDKETGSSWVFRALRGSVPQTITSVYGVGDQSGVHFGKGIPITWQLWASLNLIGGREEKFSVGNCFMNIHELWGLHIRKENLKLLDWCPS